MESTDQSTASAPESQTRQLPRDFAKRVATKIILTNERERDPEVATQTVADLIYRNLGAPDRYSYLFDVTQQLIEDSETARFSGIAWASFALEREQHPEYEKFLSGLLDMAIDEHMNLVKPLFELETKRKKFSHYAWLIGEVFINMMAVNSDLYDVINHVFGSTIRKEMALEAAQKDKKEPRRISIGSSAKEKETASKKLFDDIIDYIHTRGEFKSDSLASKNPNEFVAILADRMRGTRRYVIQDIMNRQALQRRKKAEKALSERLASAEEIISARNPFIKAVDLFWTEKRYNFKYLSVEKVRVTVQVLAILIGIVYFLSGYLGLYGMHWAEGIIIAAGMYLFARIAASRQTYKRFFPDDVSKELEIVVGSFTPTLRKMSKEQLDAFLLRLIRDTGIHKLLHIVPEFIKYVFAVMPDRKNMIVTIDELSDVMENLEIDVARQMREISQAPRNPLD